VALLDWPDYANAGDHFIWLGEKILLAGIVGTRIIHEASLKKIDFWKISNLPASCVFIVNGGGNFGDLYPYHQRFREALAASFPDRRLVFMPQSVYFNDAAALRRSRDIFARHPDLHLFARDRRSHHIMCADLRVRNAHLGIDSAVFLSRVVGLIQQRFPPPSRSTLRLLRRDKESLTVGVEKALADDSTDWASAESLNGGHDQDLFDLKRCGLDTKGALGGDFDAVSWRRLCGAVELFASAEQIVSDRLHAHILCLLMGKKHVMLDNSYGKLGDFHATWEAPEPLAGIDRMPHFLRRGFSRIRRGARPLLSS
jgi:pyruvyl transferase EpsO